MDSKNISCIVLWFVVLVVFAYVYHTVKKYNNGKSSFASTTSTTVTIDSVPDKATGDAILAATTNKVYGFPKKTYDIRKGPGKNGSKWDNKKDKVNSFPVTSTKNIYVLSLYVNDEPERIPFPLVNLGPETMTRLKNVITQLTSNPNAASIETVAAQFPTDPAVFKVIHYNAYFLTNMQGYTPNAFSAADSTYRKMDNAVFDYNAEVVAVMATNFVPDDTVYFTVPMESEYLPGLPRYHWRFLSLQPATTDKVKSLGMTENTKIRIEFDNGLVPLRSGEYDIRLRPADWWPSKEGQANLNSLMTSRDYKISLPTISKTISSFSPPPGIKSKTVGVYLYYPIPRPTSRKTDDQKNVIKELWNPDGDYMDSLTLDQTITSSAKKFESLVQDRYKLVDNTNPWAIWNFGIQDYPCVGGTVPYSVPLRKDYPNVLQDPHPFSDGILRLLKIYNDKSGIGFTEVNNVVSKSKKFISFKTGLQTDESVFLSPTTNGHGVLRIVTFKPTEAGKNPIIVDDKFFKIPNPGNQQSQYLKAALIQAKLITTTAMDTTGFRKELIEPEEAMYVPPTEDRMTVGFKPSKKFPRSSPTEPLYTFETLQANRCAEYSDPVTSSVNLKNQIVLNGGDEYEVVGGVRGGLYCFPKNNLSGMPTYYEDFVKDNGEGRPVLNNRLGYYCPTWTNFEGKKEFIPGCPIMPDVNELVFWNIKFDRKLKGGYTKDSMAVQGTVQTLQRGGVTTQINNSNGTPNNSVPDTGYRVGDVIQLSGLNIDPNWVITRWFYPSTNLYPDRVDVADFLTPTSALNPVLVNVLPSELDLIANYAYSVGTNVNAKFRGSTKKFNSVIRRMPSSDNNTYDLEYVIEPDLPVYITITARMFSRTFEREFGTITGTLGILDNTFLVTSVNYQMPDRSRNMTVFHWSDIRDQLSTSLTRDGTFLERRDYGPGSLTTGPTFALPTKELTGKLKMLSIFAPDDQNFQIGHGYTIPPSQVKWFGGNRGVLRFVQFDPTNGNIIDDFTVQNTTNNEVIEVRANLNTFMIRDTDVFVFDLNRLTQPPTGIKWNQLNLSSKRPRDVKRFKVGDRVEVLSRYTDQYGGAQYVNATIVESLDSNTGKFRVRYDTPLPRGVDVLDPNEIYFSNMRFPREASIGVVSSYSAHQVPGFDNRFNAINNDDELQRYGVKIVDLDNFGNSLHTIEYVMRGNHVYTNKVTSVVSRWDGRVFGNFDTTVVELGVPSSYIRMIDDSTGSSVPVNTWKERYNVEAKLVLKERRDIFTTSKPSKRFYRANIVSVNPDGTFDVKYNLGGPLLRRRRELFVSQFKPPTGSTDFWKYASVKNDGTANTDIDKYYQRAVRGDLNFITTTSVPATPVGLTPTGASNASNPNGRLVFNGWTTKVLSTGIAAPGSQEYLDVEACDDWTMNAFVTSGLAPSRNTLVNGRQIPVYTVYGNFIPEGDVIADCASVEN